MKKILIILVLFNIFSSFIICMQQPEATGAELELFEAIDNGDATRVQQLIDEGVNFKVNRMYKGTGIAPINLAAERKPEILKIIQDAYDAKLTPNDRFLAAIKEDEIDKAKKIIINGGIGNVNNPKDKDGNTALMLAVQSKNVGLARDLLSWKADINIQNREKESALTLALKLKEKRLINSLLNYAYNMEIDQQDKDGNTPLMLAVQNGDLEIIEKIVAEVPDTTKKNLQGKDAYDLVSPVKDTENKSKIAELLINAEKQYELYDAILKGNFTAIKSSDAPLNISSAERNPLVVAALIKSPYLSDLIKKGADVNQILRGEKTLIWRMAMSPSVTADWFRFLLGLKPKLDIADVYDDYTPIFLALKSDNPTLLQLLIDHKADVNYQSTSYFPGEPEKMTPLMFAARAGQTSYVENLIKAGADPLLQNSEGQTALDLARTKQKVAVDKGRYQTIIMLLEDKIKTIPSTKPITPVTPSTPPVQPTQLISLLHNLTQQLRGLQRMLRNNIL